VHVYEYVAIIKPKIACIICIYNRYYHRLQK